MTRRPILLILTVAAALLTAFAAPVAGANERAHATDAVRAVRGGSFRPDAWIKLCGQSTGCKIDPLPHRWFGKDVYNATGRKQTVSELIDQGEDVRFWISVENDGTETDTLTVQGCKGTRYFELRHVVLGKYKRPDAGATEVTKEFKDGTLTFDLDPAKKSLFTVLFVTHIKTGITYRCFITVRSPHDPNSPDTVVAEMTTF